MRLASVSEGARGSAGVGALTLSSAAGVVSTIDFSGSASILQFSGFAQTTNGSILNITNWGGNLAGNGAEQLLFSGSAASFTSTFGQNEIQFGGISGYNILDSGAFFEIVPVPEPSTWVAGILTLLAIGWPQRRRLRGLIAK